MKLIDKKSPEEIQYRYIVEIDKGEVKTICNSIHMSIRECKQSYDELKQAHNDNMLNRIAHEQQLEKEFLELLYDDVK